MECLVILNCVRGATGLGGLSFGGLKIGGGKSGSMNAGGKAAEGSAALSIIGALGKGKDSKDMKEKNPIFRFHQILLNYERTTDGRHIFQS